MTFYQFNMLSEMEQAEAIWSATHIATRHDEEHDILLYEIDSFFVEVFYHRTCEVIRKIEAIGHKSQLLFYGGQIDIDRVM